jgi:serine/threonine-protein phosphatase 2A regulatory subunit B
LIPHAADVISAVEFNADGSYLATGDKGGRVVLFEQVASQAVSCFSHSSSSSRCR